VIVDAFEKCPHPGELVKQLHALQNRYPAAILVTTASEEDVAQLGTTDRIALTDPAGEERARLATVYGTSDRVAKSDEYRTRLEICVAAQVVSELPPDATNTDTLDAYIRRRTQSETVRAGLRCLAVAMDSGVRTALPIADAELALRRFPPLAAAPWAIDEVLDSLLVDTRQGRRIGEVLQVRWDCLGRYGGLPMFWHDQTKVGNYDAAIRIPERLHDVIAERQRKTLDRFFAQHGRRPGGAERAGLALFPTSHRNHDGSVALTYQWFHSRFREWIAELDLGHCVPHQARHTLATNLLRAGASLTHIRRYLGQVSDRMAEHYVHLSNSDLEDVLQQVWVAGPGTANPGELLNGAETPMTREQAQALAIDLSRRSTSAEGGFCTFQPVVDGGACPSNLDCHNCDKFVLSGADLLYWRRKREQWRQLAEGTPR